MSDKRNFSDIFSEYERVCSELRIQYGRNSDLKCYLEDANNRLQQNAIWAERTQRALDNASDLVVEFQDKFCEVRSENMELRENIAYLTPTLQELQREHMELKNFVAWIEPTTHKALKRIRELEVENLSMDWVLMPNEPVEELPKTPSADNNAIMPPAPRKRTRTARMRTGGLNAQTLRRINAQTQDE